MSIDARLPGFHRLPRSARLDVLVKAGWLSPEEARALARGPLLDREGADAMSENVVGIHGLPLAICPNLRVDGRDRTAPMVIEEPSVVAAASNAARMVRAGGGFETHADPPLMIAQIEICDLFDPERAARAVTTDAALLVEKANALIPNMVARGGGARSVEVRRLPPHPGAGAICVHVHVDCRDAMGANVLNTVAEGLAPHVLALTGGRAGLRILSNYADRRLVRVRCRVPVEALRSGGWPDGGVVRDRVVAASRFAEADPYRAVTHNKGLMNGLDAVLLATGQDWRQAEAAAHAHAARSGTYRPLAVWRVGEDGALAGEAELPLAVGVVGGAARAHPGARLTLRLARARGAGDLAALAASVGLASNLAALRALATDGIQRGHMALHARTVALEAGAVGDAVHRVASRLVAERCYRVERAREILATVGP